MGSGANCKAPEAREFFSRIFMLKVTLQSVSYRKNGERDVLLAPPVILLGEQLLPCPQFPVPAPIWTTPDIIGC